MTLLVEAEGRNSHHAEYGIEAGVDRQAPAVFVYCCNGGVDKYEDARFLIGRASLLVVHGDRILAIYDPAKVFIATRTPIAPPIMF